MRKRVSLPSNSTVTVVPSSSFIISLPLLSMFPLVCQPCRIAVVVAATYSGDVDVAPGFDFI